MVSDSVLAADISPIACEYQPAWLSWVASATACLRAIGIDCNLADVAGYSGYAFHACIHETACPSGLTMLEWSQLAHAGHALGRSTCEFRSPCSGASEAGREAACRAAFEMVARELEAGRPCVLWGTYQAEFGVAVGIEHDAYVVKTSKEAREESQPNIPYDKTCEVGGIYALGFPAPAECCDSDYDLHAITLALRAWNQPAFAGYRYGTTAYGLWVKSLKAKRAISRGCGYSAACYAEGRALAADFLERMAQRRPFIKDPLLAAAESYGEAAKALKSVSTLLPFPAGGDEPVSDDEMIAEVVVQLKKSRDAESRAIGNLADASIMRWPKE